MKPWHRLLLAACCLLAGAAQAITITDDRGASSTSTSRPGAS